MCALLKKSLYGTQDASAVWQHNYCKRFEAAGYTRGRSNGALLYNAEDDVCSMTHGDDFAVLGDDEGIDRYEDPEDVL